MKNTKLKSGQKVIYKGEKRTIYAVYPKDQVSLCLVDEEGYEYLDCEEDYLIDVGEVAPIPKTK